MTDPLLASLARQPLVELQLDGCQEVSSLASLGGLQTLRHLSLESSGVVSVDEVGCRRDGTIGVKPKAKQHAHLLLGGGRELLGEHAPSVSAAIAKLNSADTYDAGDAATEMFDVWFQQAAAYAKAASVEARGNLVKTTVVARIARPVVQAMSSGLFLVNFWLPDD